MKSTASLIAALALLAVLSPCPGAERNATLSVDFKVKGQEKWGNPGGTDVATVRYTQHVSFSTVVRTDGEVVDFNPRDPGYAAQQMAKAAQVALAVTQAQGQKPMTQAEFQSRVEKAQAACKGEMQCLMGLAAKTAEWSMQMTAGMSPEAPAQQGSGSYLQFFGFEGCGAKIHIELASSTEGHYADVQGAVPFSVTSMAKHDAGPLEAGALCTQSSFVVDTVRKRFQGDGWLVSAPVGTTTRVNCGRTTTSSRGEIPFREELIEWASAQLRDAPLTGTRKGVVKMKSSNGTGIPFVVTQGEGGAEVELTWRFE
jgi:hypothetical protein